MLRIIWRIAQVALLGAIVGYVIAGPVAIALGSLMALVVGALWELERRDAQGQPQTGSRAR